jgi:hypothetical protein
MGRADWPNRSVRELEDLSLWDALRAQPTLLYDGSWLARCWWDLRHPPKWVDWIPPWRRHRRRCNRRFEEASIKLMAQTRTEPASMEEQLDRTTAADEFRRATGGITYCSTCDYWHLTPRNPLFWLVLVFGEH